MFRSLTPFLRSQGHADGHGLVFNSRISPSPNRSIHRRRKHRHSIRSSIESGGSDISAMEETPRISRRNLSKEMEQVRGKHPCSNFLESISVSGGCR